jgi:phosphoribosylanthranilate isomerase
MMRVKVKICGLTNLEDTLMAADMGADMLGFNFFPQSKRHIEIPDALDIINKIPTFVDTVGVFVNPTMEDIREVAEQGFLNWIQLHGDETTEFCDSLRWLNTRTIKAIRVKESDDITSSNGYNTDAILFDTFVPGEYGGTGQRFDWTRIGSPYQRIFLAGGITPDNVAQAVDTGVYAIDICSGIESKPGKKDYLKMRQLFENIRHTRG